MKAILAIILGAVGLLLSTCGLVFIGFSGSGANGVLPIALPCVLAGGLLLWGAVALFNSWRKSRAAAKAASLPDDAAPPN